jgi:transposase
MAWRQGQSYSDDLRTRVLAAVDAGMAVRAAAPLFQVSISYIYKALIRRRTTGEASASLVRGHRPRKLTPDQEAALAVHVQANSDMTLAAMQTWLEAEHGVRLSSGSIWMAIDRLGLTLKKSHSRRANRTGRTLRPGAEPGRRHSPSSTPTGSSSSTKPAPQRR